MTISYLTIDSQLDKCVLQTFGRTGKDRMYYDWAAQTLTWYIRTGRACADWLRAFCKANPVAMMRVAAKHSGSNDDCIRAVNKYLARYYGFAA